MEEIVIAAASLVLGGGGMYAFQRFTRRPRKHAPTPGKNPGSDEYQRWKGR